jgi:uncharacterized peroxidase-related enzyme
MSYLRSLPGEAGLLRVFKVYPGPVQPLLDLHEQVMRAPSPFTAAERELIAAYVSGLNACRYCHGAHAAAAEAFGVPPGLVSALVADIDSAQVDERMKPLLRYLGKLTRTPAQLTKADADEVFAAGWDDRALHDAVLVCALFNFMNRMVDGLGIRTNPDHLTMAGERLRRIGYAGLAALIEDEKHSLNPTAGASEPV